MTQRLFLCELSLKASTQTATIVSNHLFILFYLFICYWSLLLLSNLLIVITGVIVSLFPVKGGGGCLEQPLVRPPGEFLLDRAQWRLLLCQSVYGEQAFGCL